MLPTQSPTVNRPLLGPRYENGAPAALALGADARAELAQVLQKFLSQQYVFEPRACAVCEGHDFQVLAEQDRYGMPIKTTICCGCGLIQTNPDMREEDYTDFYTHHYRRLYIADLVGQPSDFFREEYWRGQKILAYVRQHIRLPKGRLVVEIGCGAGGILQAFADAGYRVIGTDLGFENLSYGKARGLDLRSGDLFSLVEELDEKPALIIYSHVLEHIREPGRTLDRVRQTLADDGHLYVEVPGVKDVRSNVFQGDFLKTFHLAHIYNFSLLTLRNLASKHGFSLVSGDEKIRSIFKRGELRAEHVRFESDHDSAVAYMLKTEQWRDFYRRRFVAKMAVQSVSDAVRSTGVGFLRKAGLYQFARRLMLRS